MREEIIGDARLILGDCRDVLPTLGKVDAVVTSPPYWNQRDYENSINDKWDRVVPQALSSISNSGNTQIFINLGLIFRNGELIEYWTDLMDAMRSCGWRMFGWYVWDKGFSVPIGDQSRLGTSHEWIFHFNKKTRAANKWVPTKQRTNIYASVRKKDGTLRTDFACAWKSHAHKQPDSVLRISPHMLRGGVEKNHPAVFPVELPEQLIRTYTQEDHVTLDPFMCSGTTGVACARLGRRFIGIEIEPKYFDIACRRIEEAYKQPRLFAEPRQQPKQESLL